MCDIPFVEVPLEYEVDLVQGARTGRYSGPLDVSSSFYMKYLLEVLVRLVTYYSRIPVMSNDR
jgi:hypothetical protein